MIDSSPSTAEFGIKTKTITATNKETAKLEPISSHGIIELNEWQKDNVDVLTSSLLKAEELLGIEAPYKVRLFQNKVDVLNNGGKVGVVDDGAIIVTKDGDATVILAGENLGTPSKYSLIDTEGSSVAEVITTRDEEVIIAVGEELFHLSDELKGKLPTIIDPAASYEGKYEQRHERNAALFRVRLLSSMKPDRWEQFQNRASFDYAQDR